VKEHPAVSVLVTTYNHVDFVWECLESLAAQTFSNFEVIVTDDASSDGTPDLIATWLSLGKLPARLLRNKTNRGICANRNTALSLATGCLICSLSGDDAYEPDRISRQVACFMKEPPATAVVYSDMRRIDANGRDLGASFLEYHLGKEPPPEGEVFRRLLRRSFVPSPAAMVRRAALDAVGRYDESLFFEDYDMWLRLSRHYSFRYLPGCLVRYRVLATSMSRSRELRPAMLESTARILMSCQAKLATAEPHLLWQLGKIQLLLGRDKEARTQLTKSAEAYASRWRRLAVGALHIPGVCAMARCASWARHMVRRPTRLSIWRRRHLLRSGS
jgi:glycosyltransferase involved in cell wall biosynthesis